MNTSVSQFEKSPFDSIRQIDNTGREFWSARDLQELLGYVKWQNFEEAIDRAMASCKNVGHNPADHWVTGVSKSIISGKGRKQQAKDYHMTRYACYLVAMNGDPHKPEIAAAQNYFVIKTREAELGISQSRTVSEFELFNMPNELRQAIEKEEDQILAMTKHVNFLKYGENLRYPQQARTRGKRKTSKPNVVVVCEGIVFTQLLITFEAA